MGIRGSFRNSPRLFLTATSLVVSVGVFGGFVSSPATAKKKSRPKATKVAPATSQPALGAATRYVISSRTEAFEDTARGTAKTAVSAATTSRKLPTLVISPKDAADAKRKFPLFVFSHGLGGEPELYRPLLEAIAARGYVVAAPTFPLSNAKSPGGPNLFDEPNQPGDVSFVITQMSKDVAVNPELVVAGGHSLGAITTIDLIGNSCCFEKRVDAAVIVAGTANVFSAGKLFQGTAIPSLYIHGDKDATVAYSLGYNTWKTAQTPKWFMTVIGGDHSFGIAGKPELLKPTGALIVDAIVRFADSRVGSGATVPASDADTTKALQAGVDANPTVFRLESVTP